MLEALKTGGAAGPTRGPGEEKRESAPVNSRAANYAVIDRMRDLAKWLIVVLGAIGGVLLTGAQLSDLGDTEGRYLTLALCGITLGIVGAGVALWFTVRVLLPVRISLHKLAGGNAPSAVTKLVSEEPEALRGHGPKIEDLKRALDAAEKAKQEAKEKYEAKEDCKKLKRNFKKTRSAHHEIEDDANAFVTHALTEMVRLRMTAATIAMLAGGSGSRLASASSRGRRTTARTRRRARRRRSGQAQSPCG